LTISDSPALAFSKLTADGYSFDAVEGVPVAPRLLATFGVPDPDSGPYQAVVDWGDGTQPEVLSLGAPSYSAYGNVVGGHTYPEAGSYLVHVHLEPDPGDAPPPGDGLPPLFVSADAYLSAVVRPDRLSQAGSAPALEATACKPLDG